MKIFDTSRGKNGFTIVELMIVLTVIAVMASIAVPYLLRVRVQSNETAAIGNLRTISSAAESFRTTQNPPKYPAGVDDLVNSTPSYLDSSWTSGQRQGYEYEYAVSSAGETYSDVAQPIIANISGVNSYCIDHTGVVKKYTLGSATGDENGCGAGGTPV